MLDKTRDFNGVIFRMAIITSFVLWYSECQEKRGPSQNEVCPAAIIYVCLYKWRIGEGLHSSCRSVLLEPMFLRWGQQKHAKRLVQCAMRHESVISHLTCAGFSDSSRGIVKHKKVNMQMPSVHKVNCKPSARPLGGSYVFGSIANVDWFYWLCSESLHFCPFGMLYHAQMANA